MSMSESLRNGSNSVRLILFPQNESKMKAKFSSGETYINSQDDDEKDASGKSLLESRKTTAGIGSRASKAGETRKTLVAVLYFGLVCLTKAFVQTIVHDRVPDMKKHPPLPDLILDNLPLMPWAFFASELIGLFFGILFFAIIIFHKHRYLSKCILRKKVTLEPNQSSRLASVFRLVILRRMCSLNGTLFFMRCISMLVTSLSVPSPHLHCESKVRDNSA